MKTPSGNLFTRNSLVLATALALSTPMAGVKAESRAQTDSSAQIPDESAMQFDIPAQDLLYALAAFTAQSHVQVLYEGDITQGLRSTPLQGFYTPTKALQVLLTATGLQERFTSARTVTLGPEVEREPDLLTTVTVSGDPSDAFAEPEDRIHYNLPNASSTTKTDTPIMQTPASIQIVPRAVMDDQQVISVEDALKNVSGVQNYQDFYVNPLIRGFTSDTLTLRNGLRQDAVTNLETGNLSRIEVVKGPASVLYGRIQPGGIVDLITNRPQDAARYSLQQQFGSYSLYRTVLDATGPLREDKSLLYRLNFVYKANNSFRDYVNADHVFVMPSLTWRPSDVFDVNLNMEYQHDQFISDSGLVTPGTAPLKLPISSFLADGSALQAYPTTQDRVLFAFDWNYHINADWKLTNRFKFNKTDYQQTIFNNLSMLNPSTLMLGLYHAPLTRNTYATNLDLTGHFDTGIVQHSVLLGYDYYRFDEIGGTGHIFPQPALLPPVNIYNPYQYPINLSQATVNFSYKQLDSWNGLYFQDQMALWDQLHILFGGRWDSATSGYAQGYGAPLDSFGIPTNNNNAFKPRAGLLYQPWAWGSIYANYVQSFGINNGYSSSGQPMAPETATQYEAGVKTEFFDQRLMATLALYTIIKNNMLTPIPGNVFYSVPIGQARSKGVELDIKGQISKNISLIGTYSYISAKITQANDGTQGNMLPNVPLNSGSLWAKYAFDNEVLPGVSMGTGVYLQGMRQGDITNSFQLPGYARWDAMAAYSFEQFGGKITTQLNVYNILNQIYYANSQGDNMHIIPGIPLTFLGSVRVEF